MSKSSFVERNKAVRAAWNNERELVQEGKGTREWTPEQQKDILEKGRAYDDNGMQLRLNRHFCFHVADVISFEGIPFIRSVSRTVAGTAAVALGGCARLAEVFDEFLSLGQLLLLKTENGTDAFQ